MFNGPAGVDVTSSSRKTQGGEKHVRIETSLAGSCDIPWKTCRATYDDGCHRVSALSTCVSLCVACTNPFRIAPE
jgi:hypothetical protein